MQPTQYPVFWVRMHRLLLGLALLVALALGLGLSSVVRADVLIMGACTIVSNPTSTHFTDCPGANLIGADLSGGIDLSFANLSGANLSGADISDAILNDATLTGANLTGADLNDATLNNANLNNANLTNTNLDNTNLSGANLTGITWNNTVCPDLTNSNNNGNTCLGHLFLPTITTTATQANGSAYTAGVWTNQNVTVHFTCTAVAGHTPVSCPTDQTFTADGSATANGRATDVFGFFTDTSFGPVQIDKTPPSITVSATKADNTAYTAGTWSNQNVTIHFSCSDVSSGLAGTCPADQVFSADGVTSAVNGAVTDKAGNSANASFGPIQIDRTRPAITGNRTPAADANGWNNSDVTVSFTCADNQNGSGLATNTVAGATVSSEGADQAVTNTGACVDNAGNAADAATVTPINIDKSDPDTTITRQPDDPSPLVATFEFSGADTVSGVAAFTCSLDGAPLTACTSPQAYTGLTAGQHTFQVQARDVAGHVDATPASYTWTASADLPVADDQTLATAEDTPLAITLQATGKNALTYAVISGPAHGVLSGAPPTLIYTPTADFNGADSFTFRAIDGQLKSNLAKVTINVTPVNDPPVWGNQGPLTVAEDTPLSLTLSVQDVDGDALTYALLSPPAHGSLSGALPNATYTPAANFNGSDSFVFSVADGGQQVRSALVNLLTGTVQINVTAINDAPVAADQTVTTPPNTPITLTLAAADADADPLTYTIIADPQHGALSGAGANRSYTPADNFIGNDQLTFQVSDGQVTSDVATITILVTSQPFASFLPLVGR